FDARLFLNLAHGGLGDGFAGIHGPAGNGPQLVVPAAPEQDAAFGVRDHCRRCGHEPVRPGSVGVVVVLDPGHHSITVVEVHPRPKWATKLSKSPSSYARRRKKIGAR